MTYLGYLSVKSQSTSVWKSSLYRCKCWSGSVGSLFTEVATKGWVSVGAVTQGANVYMTPL